ncbi:hypothetical protein FB45DRAFT_877288 [Roridomyces roridus]|uniref:Uncharacterized protein n=1 Tax=Roridomyces roridus TaxID=1738132 RepID=A0AAD7B274_9AGAR|nr:hypothetical protein FB45DRAFT_877288 [Roridomyces roridus]
MAGASRNVAANTYTGCCPGGNVALTELCDECELADGCEKLNDGGYRRHYTDERDPSHGSVAIGGDLIDWNHQVRSITLETWNSKRLQGLQAYGRRQACDDVERPLVSKEDPAITGPKQDPLLTPDENAQSSTVPKKKLFFWRLLSVLNFSPDSNAPSRASRAHYPPWMAHSLHKQPPTAYSMTQWMLVSREWLSIAIPIFLRDVWFTSLSAMWHIKLATCRHDYPAALTYRLAGITDVKAYRIIHESVPNIKSLHFVLVDCLPTYWYWHMEMDVLTCCSSDLPNLGTFNTVKRLFVRGANADFVAFLTTCCPVLECIESTAEFGVQDLPPEVAEKAGDRMMVFRRLAPTTECGIKGSNSAYPGAWPFKVLPSASRANPPPTPNEDSPAVPKADTPPTLKEPDSHLASKKKKKKKLLLWPWRVVRRVFRKHA